jgi:dTDP-4-dehydrorhamnose reductase
MKENNVLLWIVGANSFLGKAIQEICILKNVHYIATSKTEVDISNILQIHKFLNNSLKFTHIINCAALANVDLAELFPEEAYNANVIGPKNLGTISKIYDIPVIHFSSEYVFNGNPHNEKFNENHIPIPQGQYAKTKYEGELCLLEATDKYCIIRTSWLFGGNGKTFLSSVLNTLLTETNIKVVNDQKNRPTYVCDLAESLFFFLDKNGIYHFANSGEASKYEIFNEVKNYATVLNLPILTEEISPLPSIEFVQLNKRPFSCVLDTSKVDLLLPEPIRNWKEAVKDLVNKALKQNLNR